MDISYNGQTLAGTGDDVTLGAAMDYAADTLAPTGATGIMTIHTIAQCPSMSIAVRSHVASAGAAIRRLFTPATTLGAVDTLMIYDAADQATRTMRDAALTGSSSAMSGLAVQTSYAFVAARIA